MFIDGVSYGTYSPGDGSLQATPIGFTIPADALSGYTYVPGDTFRFDVVATADNGETLTTTHSDVLMPFLVCFAAGTMIRPPVRARSRRSGPATLGQPGRRRLGCLAPRRIAARVACRMMRTNPTCAPTGSMPVPSVRTARGAIFGCPSSTAS
ncbi:MAG: hypothetical protein R3D80_21490 [Paracoccaceae bacterium]